MATAGGVFTGHKMLKDEQPTVTVEDVRNGGETVGNKLDDAADDVRDGIDDARRELEE